MDHSTPEGADLDPSLSDTERVIAAIWSEALQLQQLPGPEDDFFELGGDSMTMTMIEFRIQEELSVEPQPGTLLSAPLLRDFSAVIDRIKRGDARGPVDVTP